MSVTLTREAITQAGKALDYDEPEVQPERAETIDDLLGCAIDDLPEAELSARLLSIEQVTLGMGRQLRKLEAHVFETREVDTEKGTLTQRIQSLERNFELYRKVQAEKEKRAEQERARNGGALGLSMNTWCSWPLTKAREEAIEVMLEGGERFERMAHIRVRDYGDIMLDVPDEGQHIETPDFIVLDALPEVLRQAFMEQFAPAASLIREDATSHLALARFDDWQAFAKAFV